MKSGLEESLRHSLILFQRNGGLVAVVVCIKPQASCVVAWFFMTELYLQPSFSYLFKVENNYMYGCFACFYVCTMSSRNRKRASDPLKLELKLEMALNFQLGAGIQIQVF